MLTESGTTFSLAGDRDLRRRLPLFDMCAAIALAGLIAALAMGRSDVLALAAPFVVAVTVALATWRTPDGTVTVQAERHRVTEGDDVTFTVRIASEAGLARVIVELQPDDRLAAAGPLRAVTAVRAGEPVTLTFAFQALEWGVAKIERASVQVTDRLGMFGGHVAGPVAAEVHIGLPEDRASSTLDAERFRRIVGSHLSDDRGQGMEIADIRPFQRGDSSRNINWRISNRRREPWVTLRHPDRSTTTIVVVDAHDGERQDQRITQRRSVAAAMALSRGHLAQHDRVGLLVVGHTLRWLSPKLGRNQLYQISDCLISVSNAPEASRRMYRPPAVSTIPNDAIVVAITPLRDPLMVALVAEMRSRGNPVSVLVPGLTDTGLASSERSLPRARRIDEHARRLARVEYLVGVQSLRERGVAIVPWPDDQPVTTVINSVQQLRKTMARGRHA